MENDDPQSQTSVVAAPPPPSEVKIRTMRSDIAMLSASGGGLPRFENVKIAGLSEKGEGVTAITRSESKNNLALIITIPALVIALGVIAWVGFTRFGW